MIYDGRVKTLVKKAFAENTGNFNCAIERLYPIVKEDFRQTSEFLDRVRVLVWVKSHNKQSKANSKSLGKNEDIISVSRSSCLG